jgi:hypothetical protein
MSKFKVGDRVRAIRDYHVVKSGMVGTVKSAYCSNPPVGVEWDTLTDGHDGNGRGMKCERGKGYYVKEADIELLRLPSIHITTDGKTTHAVLKEGKRVVRRAKAVCSPGDEFNFETGAKLAFDRLMGYETELEKPEYYNGKVVCVEGGCFHTVGKVYEVKDGVLFDDSSTPYDGVRVESLEQLNADVAPKFIEFKGEA